MDLLPQQASSLRVEKCAAAGSDSNFLSSGYMTQLKYQSSADVMFDMYQS
jgi:hypothetical protein